ncbi:MAG TPA: extracellular solute-binding protein, partial [Isosphaeraceae bacterium]|nr:extracellular solute-binding protein [Isosphaeraceae bacterium]
FDAAREPKRWSELTRKPGVGPFRLGHTDPENSNSGLHALFLMAYAATGKFDGQLTRGELIQPEFLGYLREVEGAVPHPLESSTGFLAKSMIERGPSQMTAAIVYENLVIEANRRSEKGPLVVAVYPSEGTFQSEHPVGIVNRSWVTAKHREAAEKYINYLLARPQQEKAKAHGLRPSLTGIAIEDMLKPELGVSAAQPRTLPTPSATLITTIRNQWHQYFAGSPAAAGTQRGQ